jgi:LPPG:FO 2-phospho-L-lactate transferase
VISIGPILALPGMREAIAAASAPVVAISPLVGGRSLKGPTEAFLQALRRPLSAAGVASLYAGLLDGMVADPDDPGSEPEGARLLTRPTVMSDKASRRRLAEDALAFARELA